MSAFTLKPGRNARSSRLALPSAFQEFAESESKAASGVVRQSIGGQDVSQSTVSSSSDHSQQAIIPVTHADSVLKIGLTAGRVGGATGADSSVDSDKHALVMDLKRLPDAPVVGGETYEAMSIEEYGSAILRGMGLRPGQKIGLSQKALVTPKEPIKRPQLAGLGAVSSEAAQRVLGGTLADRSRQVRAERRDMESEENKSENNARESESRVRDRTEPSNDSVQDDRRSHRRQDSDNDYGNERRRYRDTEQNRSRSDRDGNGDRYGRYDDRDRRRSSRSRSRDRNRHRR